MFQNKNLKAYTNLNSIASAPIVFRSAIEAVRDVPSRSTHPSLSGNLIQWRFIPLAITRRVRWSVQGSVIGRDGAHKEPIRPFGSLSRESTVLPPRECVWRVCNKNKYEISSPTDNGLYQMVIMCMGWYRWIRLDTPISEIYTGCWASMRPIAEF